jgi:hypothetical protein
MKGRVADIFYALPQHFRAYIQENEEKKTCQDTWFLGGR